jgi:hypothetical protein
MYKDYVKRDILETLYTHYPLAGSANEENNTMVRVGVRTYSTIWEW